LSLCVEAFGALIEEDFTGLVIAANPTDTVVRESNGRPLNLSKLPIASD
jgi:hypothetical protein